MDRTILHIDLDAFFCAVEELHNPDLVGKAFAVGGNADQRGVVASCSYPARVFGVRSAMPMARALKLCPHLIVVRSSFGAYREKSHAVMDILHSLTPLVEPLSIDEAFIDITGVAGTPLQHAKALQTRIRDELSLPCSIGVATNKLVAKTANNIGKANTPKDGRTPNAIKVVPPGTEAAFMAALPIEELWGVGPKTAENLRRMGLRTVGDIARYPAKELERRFGRHGADLAQRARGEDDRPVEPEREAKSISKETTFARDEADAETLKRTLRQLSEQVGQRLRRNELRATTVRLKLRWRDFTTITRQSKHENTVDQDEEIYRAALDLFEAAWRKGRPVRLIGVGVSGLEQGDRQLGLWEDPTSQEKRKLQSALDDLRDRFGNSIIQRGSDL